MEVDLGGQVALVVGAASPIGTAVADRFAASGAIVVAADRAAPPDGRWHLALAFDPGVEADAASAVVRAADAFGRLDILVNAGCTGEAAPIGLDELSVEAFRRALDLHLASAFLCARAAARPMLARGCGRIVTIASAAGMVPVRGHGAFAVAQAGLVALTRAMAAEWSDRGVLVGGLAVGAVGDAGDLDRRLLSHIPLARPATLGEIADAALFLVDPENSYLTGHTLVVDGGWAAGYARDF